MLTDRASKKDFGVFLPVANGGWIVSSATPPLNGLWRQNREAAILADKVGMDFVMSMGKWRGFGGETNHWGTSMESLTMMAAIADATTRIKVWATAHPLLHNPAVTAKMLTTIDHISGGRAGLNVVSGGYRDEFSQMGAWDDALSHDDRYALTEEWTAVVKRLWREDSVDFDGRFFHLEDCQSNPKPVSRPRPDIICAGMSERGFRFAAKESDACFIGGRDRAEYRDFSRKAKRIAAECGNSIRTYAMCTVIYAETDAKAEGLVKTYAEGQDMGAIIAMLKSWGTPPGRLAAAAEAQGPFMTQTAVGSPATCAEKIQGFIEESELDGLMLIFPDYMEGLAMIGDEVLPRMQRAFA